MDPHRPQERVKVEDRRATANGWRSCATYGLLQSPRRYVCAAPATAGRVQYASQSYTRRSAGASREAPHVMQHHRQAGMDIIEAIVVGERDCPKLLVAPDGLARGERNAPATSRSRCGHWREDHLRAGPARTVPIPSPAASMRQIEAAGTVRGPLDGGPPADFPFQVRATHPARQCVHRYHDTLPRRHRRLYGLKVASDWVT